MYCIFHSILFQVLLAVYLVAVVWLVRRQIYKLDDEVDEDRILMTDQEGKTDIRKIEHVLSDKKEVLM